MDAGFPVIAVFAALAGSINYAAARRARRERERLDAEGVIAEGEVLEVWPDGTAFRVRYRYTPHGAGKAMVRTELAPCLRVLVPDPGAKVRVRYHPRDWNRARLLRDDE
ncbi:MAG: hypothetical protein WCA09_05010 [Burkholderiales bacterium]